MKNYLLFLLLAVSVSLFGQTPQAINYQIIVRDTSGNPRANKTLWFRLTIKDSTANTYSYRETHIKTTNRFGLATLLIGRGTPLPGYSSSSFSSINWGNSHIYKIRTEIADDITGTDSLFMGSSELLSVPFALYAKSASIDTVTPKYYTNYMARLKANISDTGIYLLGKARAVSTYEPKIGQGSTGQFWSWNKTWQTVPIPDTVTPKYFTNYMARLKANISDTGTYLLGRTRAASTYEPKIAQGSTGQFWSWDKTWQTVPIPDTITPKYYTKYMARLKANISDTGTYLLGRTRASHEYEPKFGTLAVNKGGTGNASLTQYAILAGGTTPTGTMQQLGIGIVGQLLQSSGTGLPLWWTPTYISGNQTITLSGDASGSGTTAIPITLATLSPNPSGSYNNVTVNGKGLVTGGNTVSYENPLIFSSPLSRNINTISLPLTSSYFFVGNASNNATGVAMSGDATISNSGVLTLANTTVSGGTYGNSGANIPNITVDNKGRLTLAANRALTPALILAEPAITPGTNTQYWRGDKTWRTSGTDFLLNQSASAQNASFNITSSTSPTAQIVNSSSTGTGVVGIGNVVSPVLYSGGACGGQFIGNKYGIYVSNPNISINTYAGYFNQGGAAGYYWFVGGTGAASGTQYKISGPGSAATVISDQTGKKVMMFCPETPEVLFMDGGVGNLTNGKCHIELDPTLSKNIVVSEDLPLKVFVQLEGDCKGVYVANKTKLGFDVIELQGGNSNVPFSWHIIANRCDSKNKKGTIVSKHEGIRFPPAPEFEQSDIH